MSKYGIMSYVCRRYHNGIIRREHEYYVAIADDVILACTDTEREAEQEIDEHYENKESKQ